MFLFLRKGPDDVSNDPDKQQTILFGHVVPEFYIEQLLLFCFIMLALTAHVFASNYLFIKTFGCSREAYIHCFAARTHFLVVDGTELNCLDFDSVANITSIICYDLTLNFPRAIGTAGSTLAGGAVYFGLITWALLKLSSRNCWKKRRSIVKTVVITSVQMVVMLVALIMVQARLVALFFDQDTVYEDIVLLVIYNYVVIVGGLLPWKMFKRLEKPTTKKAISGDCGNLEANIEIELNTQTGNGGMRGSSTQEKTLESSL